ncbi:MAG: antitoxin [Gammaproteobacteria bacterium]|nr:antitoxin [Gammaproteobacteria bacterium]
MRTTLNIDDEVLQAAKALARQQRKTTGEVLSELARRAITGVPAEVGADLTNACHGFVPFPSRGGIVTDELIASLRELEDV